MTAVPAPPPALAAYLRRATAGLPPAKRQEVWDELEEHVYCRAEQLEWQGAAPEQALAQALAELGPPLRVSAGMNGVHNMPKLIAVGGIAALVLSASLYALAQNQQTLNVPVLSERPGTPICSKNVPKEGVRVVERKGEQTCYVFENPAFYKGAYLSLTKLRNIVQAQGGKAEVLNDGRWKFSFPNTLGKTSLTTKVAFIKDGESYVNASIFMATLLGLEASATLQGFKSPQIALNGMTIGLTSQDGSAGQRLYDIFGLALASALLDDTQLLQHGLSFGPTPGKEPHTLQTGLPAGEVVMLVTAEPPSNEPVEYIDTPPGVTPPTPQPEDVNYAFSIAEVQVGGTVTLKATAKQLDFKKDIRELTARGGNKPALLVRLTNTPLNNLKTGIFLPKP